MDPIIIFPDPSQCQSCHGKGIVAKISTTHTVGVCTRKQQVHVSMASSVPIVIALTVTAILKKFF